MSDPKRFWQGVALIAFAILLVLFANSLHMAMSPWYALAKFGLIVGFGVAAAVFVSWRGERVEAEIVDPKTGETTPVSARVHRSVGDILSDLPPVEKR